MRMLRDRASLPPAVVATTLLALGAAFAPAGPQGPGPSGANDDERRPPELPADVGLRSEFRGVASTPGPADYTAKWAVVIGIDAYEPAAADYPPLNFACRDALAMLALLRDEFGFRTDPEGTAIGPGVTAARVRAALEAWPPRDQLQAGDLVAVFYAGHGTAEGDLVGCDGVEVPLPDVVKQLQDLLCRHKLLVLDSCFSGRLFRLGPEAASAGVAPRDGAGRGASPALTQADRLAAYLADDAFLGISAARTTPAQDGGADGHSIFTASLLETLREHADSVRPDQAFTFRELAARVEAKVRNGASIDQVPDWGRLGSGSGDVVFRPTILRVTPTQVSLRRQYSAVMAAAMAAYGEGDLARVNGLLDQVRPTGDRIDLRGFDWFYLWKQAHRAAARLPGHGRPVIRTAHLPSRNAIASWYDDGTIRIWDDRTLRITGVFRGGGDPGLFELAVADASGAWASMSDRSELYVRELTDGRTRATRPIPDQREDLSALTHALALSPEGDRLVWAGTRYPPGVWDPLAIGRPDLLVWDLNGGPPKSHKVGQVNGYRVLRAAYSGDGTRLALALGRDHFLGGLDPARMKNQVVLLGSSGADLRELARLEGPAAGPNNRIFSLTFAASDSAVLAGTETGEVWRWDLVPLDRARPPAGRLVVKDTSIPTPTLSADGSLVVSGGSDGLIRLFDGRTGGALGKFAEHSGEVTSVTMLPDGRRFVTGGRDGITAVWEFGPLLAKGRFTAYETVPDPQLIPHHVREARFLEGDDTLATVSGQNVLKVWDLVRGAPKWMRAIDPAVLVAWGLQEPSPWFSPDGRLVALPSEKKPGELQVVDAATGAMVGALIGPAGRAAFSADSKRLALGDSSGTVRLWTRDQSDVTESSTGLASVEVLAFTTDGLTLVVGGPDGEAGGGVLQFWSTEPVARLGSVAFPDQAFLRLSTGPGEEASGVQAPRPGTVAVLSYTNPVNYAVLQHTARLSIFDATTRRQRGEIAWEIPAGHGDARLLFSPDGRVLFALGVSSPDHLLSINPYTVEVQARMEDVRQYPFEFAQFAFPANRHQTLVLADRALRFLDPYTLNQLYELPHEGRAMPPRLTFAPSGRVLALGSDDGTVTVLRAATEEESLDDRERYLRWCRDSDPLVRAYAIDAFSRSGLPGAQAVFPLRKALEDPSREVRIAALDALGQLGGAAAPAVEQMTTLLAAPEPGERLAAIRALGRVGGPAGEAMPGLVGLVGDDDTAVASAAYLAIHLIDPTEGQSAQLFLNRFERPVAGGDDLWVRMVNHAISRLLDDGDAAGSLAALSAGLSKTQAGPLAHSFVTAFRRLGPKAGPVTDDLVGLLRDGEPRIRAPLAAALVRVAPDRQDVVELAVEVLGRSLVDDRLGVLIPASQLYPYKPDDLSRASFAAALALLGPKARPALPALRRVAALNTVEGPSFRFAISVIDTSELDHARILGQILANPASDMLPDAVAFVAEKPALATELSSRLRELTEAPGLDPTIRGRVARILRGRLSAAPTKVPGR